jgi:exosortase
MYWVLTRGMTDGMLATEVRFSRLLNAEEAHVWLLPVVILGLFWWKRNELIATPKRIWWPAFAMLIGALCLHVLGYLAQQTRVSLVAFLGGIYALMGLLWGPRFLRASFFPFLLFALCVPLGNSAEYITFPLRLFATNITRFLSHVVLNINVIQDGTRLLDANRTYSYEVAAACSGIKSLTAIIAVAAIYGFVVFKSPWKRLLVTASAIPLAVAANVFRLGLIIIAAEAFGQQGGDFVHENSLFSLAPYLPAFGGLMLLGWLLREGRGRVAPAAKGAAPSPAGGPGTPAELESGA